MLELILTVATFIIVLSLWVRGNKKNVIKPTPKLATEPKVILKKGMEITVDDSGWVYLERAMKVFDRRGHNRDYYHEKGLGESCSAQPGDVFKIIAEIDSSTMLCKIIIGSSAGAGSGTWEDMIVSVKKSQLRDWHLKKKANKMRKRADKINQILIDAGEVGEL
jgi:hypothetical protein